jgi:predicted RNA binding protein YcfA (HicA-like mRNA interferase family)
MKLPRDLSGEQIAKKLEKIGYIKTKQTGSHIKLTRNTDSGDHHITIPNHDPVKVGTLNNIITDLSQSLKINKEEVIKILK